MNKHFFEVYSDIGAGKQGTTQGVDVLASHCQASYPKSKFTQIHPKAKAQAFEHPHGKYIEALTPFFEQTLLPILQTQLSQCEQSAHFPVIISGDHSNAMGTVSAFLNHHQHKKTAIVWIDAHADLHSIYTSPSGNLHGMPLGAILGLDNKDCQINEPDMPTQAYWERLKGLTDHTITPNDVHFLGLRSFEAPEAQLMDKHAINAYSAIDHRQAGFDKVLDELVQTLSDVQAVYVSFDVDALDERLIPATGTPVAQGYEVAEIKQIFDKLLALPNVKLFEITEFNPMLDNDKTKHQIIIDLFDYAVHVLDKR